MSIDTEKEVQVKKPSRLFKVISVAFFSVGVIFLISAGFIYVQTKSFVEKAVETRGVVVDLLRRDKSYTPLIIFTDQAGKEIEYVSNLSSNPPAYAIGEEVVIFYDLQNSHHAMLGGMALYILPIIFGAVGGVFAVLGFILIVNSRKKKQSSKQVRQAQKRAVERI